MCFSLSLSLLVFLTCQVAGVVNRSVEASAENVEVRDFEWGKVKLGRIYHHGPVRDLVADVVEYAVCGQVVRGRGNQGEGHEVNGKKGEGVSEWAHGCGCYHLDWRKK